MAEGEVDGRGGARPGAGRPKLEATKLRAALIAKAEDHAEELAGVLFEKAMSGDLPAIKEIIDRGIGKAMQPVDHTTNGKDIPTPILGAYVPNDDGDEAGAVAQG